MLWVGGQTPWLQLQSLQQMVTFGHQPGDCHAIPALWGGAVSWLTRGLRRPQNTPRTLFVVSALPECWRWLHAPFTGLQASSMAKVGRPTATWWLDQIKIGGRLPSRGDDSGGSVGKNKIFRV